MTKFWSLKVIVAQLAELLSQAVMVAFMLIMIMRAVPDSALVVNVSGDYYAKPAMPR